MQKSPEFPQRPGGPPKIKKIIAVTTPNVSQSTYLELISVAISSTSCFSSLLNYFFSFWMPGGLSHVILNAPSPGAFDQALSFYCSIGFQIVSDSNDKDESFSGKIAWLAMFSDTENKDLTVKLKVNASMNAKTCVSTDVDYALEDVVLVIATSNLQVM
jgi:hypothetical protein